MQTAELDRGVVLVRGAANSGVLIHEARAWLVDCDASCTPGALEALGVHEVQRILCTQHRRVNVAGINPFLARGAALTVPRAERHLFEDVEAHWNEFGNRWHPYHQQPGPQVLAESVRVDSDVGDDDRLEWGPFTIRVLDTPGATDGSVSYMIERDGRRIIFCGDAIYSAGQVYDVYSLQKGFNGVGDYHGFIGNRLKLDPSLRKLKALNAELLVPSHGSVMSDAGPAIDLMLDRLAQLDRNHAATSSMNYYFPKLYAAYADDPQRMTPAPQLDPPDCVLRPSGVSFVLKSESGAGLLIDCGFGDPLGGVKRLIEEGKLTALDGCWITHYHDDHVDQLDEFPAEVPLWTHKCTRELVEHPIRFHLPCISHKSAPVTRAFGERETWNWHEFRLTTMYLPGQTHYHNGLLAEGHGIKILFAGDSGSPCGLDDHCTQNRVFTGAGRGFRHCIDIWREYEPDFIFNQHQDKAFRFDAGRLNTMEQMLVEREAIYRELLPWEEPDFGIDQNWIRVYPYEQDASRGSPCNFEIQFTNHALETRTASFCDAVLPGGWELAATGQDPTARIPPRADGSIAIELSIPADCAARKFIVPVNVAWEHQPLGPVRHAVINVS